MSNHNNSTTTPNHTQDKPRTSIHRSVPDNEPWFAVARSTAQHGKRSDGLSFEARGVLLYLLSKPGDWVVTVEDIMKEGGIGNGKAKRLLADLRKHGYIVTEMTHGEHGKFAGKRDVVYSVPVVTSEPLVRKPARRKSRPTAEPSDGKTVEREIDYIQYRESVQDTESNTYAPDANAPVPRTQPDKPADKPKRKKSKANPRSAELEPDIIYETVETHIFGIEGTPDMPYQWSGRCGQITSWLKGAVASVDGQEVGKISRPAAPEHIKAFARAWVKEHTGAPLPRKPDRFVEHWRAWASKHAGARPRANLQEATPEDKAALVREYVA